MTSIPCQKCGKPTGPAFGICVACILKEDKKVMKTYDITVHAYIPQVTAETEEDAKKQIAEYIHCYAWYTFKQVIPETPE